VQKTTRRSLARLMAVGAASTVVLNIVRARSDTPAFHYKFGGDLPVSHPNSVRMKAAAEQVREQSGGRLTIDFFADNVLGGDTSMLSQLRAGAIQFLMFGGDILATVLPVADLAGTPYAFKDYNQVWAAVDGDLGGFLGKKISGIGIHVLDRWWDLGFRQITSNIRPIVAPADLKGFKIRVPVSPMRVSLFKALGAAPTAINFAELYSALQTRLVDGQETPLVTIETAKLYEVQKYCSMTRHVWSGQMTLANMAAWQRLPEELREIAARNINGAAVASRADVAKIEVAARQRMTAHGLVFNDPDQRPFRDTLAKAGFYAAWRRRFGDEAWNLLEKYAGKLG
jgi:TRAP-type transport system periplasmic protein